MPYRIDIPNPPGDALDRLVSLGALDIEALGDGLAAIIPDAIPLEALGIETVNVSPAIGRDDGSVWLLTPRTVHIGRVLVVPPGTVASPGTLLLTDGTAFGSGHHPTTALCAEAIEEALDIEIPDSILDVGTGSGVLALAALLMGVPRAVGLDIDTHALEVAAVHAQLNNLAERLQLVHGGPDVVDGVWPLVVANVLAAPLIEMAPILVRRMGQRGRLILSGIPSALESEVEQTYRRLGMRHVRSEQRAGWSVVILQASW